MDWKYYLCGVKNINVMKFLKTDVYNSLKSWGFTDDFDRFESLVGYVGFITPEELREFVGKVMLTKYRESAYSHVISECEVYTEEMINEYYR